jgi:hypothetical protein
MDPILSSDVCGICMDETNRDFLFKSCCTFLICRGCYNKLEVESFPVISCCPGCRQEFTKASFSVDSVNNHSVPRAYCGSVLSLTESNGYENHVNQCLQCMQKIIKGNQWFEMQLTHKFTSLKRKMESYEDELFVKNQRLRILSRENRILLREVSYRNQQVTQLRNQQQRSQSTLTSVDQYNSERTVSESKSDSVSAVVNQLRTRLNASAAETLVSSNTELFSEEDLVSESSTPTDRQENTSTSDGSVSLLTDTSNSSTSSSTEVERFQFITPPEASELHTPLPQMITLPQAPPRIERNRTQQPRPGAPAAIRRSERILFRSTSSQ